MESLPAGDVPLEEFAPYDESIQWERHDAFYKEHGLKAFYGGGIPSAATNTPVLAKKQAAIAVAHIKNAPGLKDTERIEILEVGAGCGRFASHFIEAFVALAGPEIGDKLRYVLSDYAQSTLEAVSASTRIQSFIASGALIPAIVDIHAPLEATTLDGSELTMSPVIVIGNYVCCISRSKQLQCKNGSWHELWAQLHVTLPDHVPSKAMSRPERLAWLDEQASLGETPATRMATSWRRLDLNSHLGQSPHQEILERLGDQNHQEPVAYPHPIFTLMTELSARMPAQGVFLWSDFAAQPGSSNPDEPLQPTRYGDTINHAVNFSLFDAYAHVTQSAIHRTQDLSRTLDHCMIATTPLPHETLQAFDSAHVSCNDLEDLIDFQVSGDAATQEDDLATASRYFRRAAEIAPEDVPIQIAWGRTVIDLGAPEDAIAILNRALEQNEASEFDVEFELGRAHAELENLPVALQWYQRALTKDPDPATYCNIGEIFLTLNENENAQQAFEAALGIDPQHQRSQKGLAQAHDIRS